MEKYLTRSELEQITLQLESAYHFVKGGPAPNLTENLLYYSTSLRNKLEQVEPDTFENTLLCPSCDSENNHLIATLTAIDNDHYETTEIIVNGKYHIPVRLKYNFRSHGNFHVLFSCEDGHFFVKSFDGHKGVVYVDKNPLMEELTLYLYEIYKDTGESKYFFDFEILGHIEKHLKSKTN